MYCYIESTHMWFYFDYKFSSMMMTLVLTKNYSVIRRGVAWLAVVRVRWLYEIFADFGFRLGKG